MYHGLIELPYCDNKKVIFLHVPKTGGTTIERLFDIARLHDSNPATNPTPQHLTCKMLRERIGDDKYESYYKFVFVRNPWSRILSSYFWRQTLPRKRPVLPFTKFIENVERVVDERLFYSQEFGDHFIPQLEYTSDVDDVFRFENFEDGARQVASRLGLTVRKIPAKKAKHYDNYREFYNDHTRQVIARIYRDEIDEFGYRFTPGRAAAR